MLDYYFTFRSITAAQQAVMELIKSGLSAYLLRAPKALATKGCGYAVRILFQSGTLAASVLRKSGISYMKCFQMGISGEWKEVCL